MNTPLSRIGDVTTREKNVLSVLRPLAFGVTAWTTVAEVLQRRDAVAATAAILSQLEGRSSTAPRGRGEEPDASTTGSPLLDGTTVTVGGANLLQRVAASITRFGGNIQYTQVDLEGPHAKDGFVSVTVNGELEQPALQQLLYESSRRAGARTAGFQTGCGAPRRRRDLGRNAREIRAMTSLPTKAILHTVPARGSISVLSRARRRAGT
jgi:hypothetical protein